MTSSSVKILVVEDEAANRYGVTRALEQAGFDVRSVPDHREALYVFNSDAPLDLLVTDVVMPDRVNGFALARMARMKRPDLKVLYMTAFDVPTDEADGKVLRKPIADEDLLAAVRACLAGN